MFFDYKAEDSFEKYFYDDARTGKCFQCCISCLTKRGVACCSFAQYYERVLTIEIDIRDEKWNARLPMESKHHDALDRVARKMMDEFQERNEKSTVESYTLKIYVVPSKSPSDEKIQITRNNFPDILLVLQNLPSLPRPQKR